MASENPNDFDRRFMGEAIELGRTMLGLTTPNPAVGCVIVRNQRIVGRGATGQGGRPHAETNAIAEAGKKARGATAYVSFEPCAHQGRTPPCARALVEAGISKVVIGCLDPYPPVRGRGIRILREAGVPIVTGVLEDECRRANEGFITRVTRGRPFVTLKLAATLDGRIAAPGGDSQWISSPESRALVHRWRRECDAVMVGARTVVADNPRLTCRTSGGRDPIRVVVDAKLIVSPAARIFRQRSAAPAIVVTTQANLSRAKGLFSSSRVEVIGCDEHGGEIDLEALAIEFGRRGWCKLLIEGGASTAASALRFGIVDRVAMFLAPKILGCGLAAIEGLAAARVRDAISIADLVARPIGEDWLLEGRPAKIRRGISARPGRKARLEELQTR
ncbi:MAG: bifunctional diaminohydroxyphosphoribosylaminopyrimidine deaminase/5-amino-6-(5-phosphoribosylamino)uracil reductase RibD [Candidatus Binataceae bacterium]|nr:bifunctional diaminohydroxyphosphoribosylaminopyrimidine deaminase/5-amino-6-(5-phosphoribosylamino)uracil reductase RibD [Candidatus Binataceae bacterium]